MRLDLEHVAIAAENYNWSLPKGRFQINSCGADVRMASDPKILRSMSEPPGVLKQVLDRVAGRACPHCVIESHLRANSNFAFNQYTHSCGRVRERRVIVRDSGRAVNFANVPDIEQQLVRLEQLIDYAAEHGSPLFAWIIAIFFLRIHPYSNGNGRAARNLAVLLLLKWNQILEVSYPSYILLRASQSKIKHALNSICDEESLVFACYEFHKLHRASLEWMEQNSDQAKHSG